MKLKKYSWLAALPMIFTACQDDALVENQQQDKMIYTLSAQMDGGAAMSRAQIQLNNPNSGEELFFWNAGDSFAMYQKQSNDFKTSVFTIASDYQEPTSGGQTSAVFNTESPVYSNMDYLAVYPSDIVYDWGSLNFELQLDLDFTGKAQEDVWKDYFRKNMFMMTAGNFSDTSNLSVSFQHMCGLVRLTYTNSTGKAQNLTSVYMDNGQETKLAYTFNLSEGEGWFNSFAYRYWLNLNGLTVEDGETVDLYMLIFPLEFGEQDLTFYICTDESENGCSIAIDEIKAKNPDATGFEAGKRYWFKLTAKEDALYLTKDFEIVTIENPEFSAVLANILDNPEEVTINEKGYAEMTRAYAKSITDLQFGWQGYVVPSLAGIEHFVNLESLGCANSGVVSCDLSKNTKLMHLAIDWNENLTKLDLSKNLKLSSLLASFNENLSSLTLPNTNTLWSLSVEHTALTSLNVPNPSNIEYLICGNNAFTSFDLSGFTNLREINIANLGLENVDFIPEVVRAQLRTLNCDKNAIGALDLSAYTSLEGLVCGKQLNKWLVLTLPDDKKDRWNNDWKNNENNTFVYLSDEAMPETVTFVNPEVAKALKHALGEEVLLFEDNTAVMYKSVVESKEGLSFYGYSGSYTTLEGIEAFINLKHLICVENNLNSLDVSAFKNLEVLECRDNKLETLVVNGCTSLRELQCL